MEASEARKGMEEGVPGLAQEAVLVKSVSMPEGSKTVLGYDFESTDDDAGDSTEMDSGDEPEDGDSDERMTGDGPVGTWHDCTGTFTRTADSFTWDSIGPEPYVCRLSGTSTFEDGILHLYPDGFDTCDSRPWWVRIFEEEHPSFVPSVHEARLSLLPTVPNDGARIFNLEAALDTENWELTDNEGNESMFRLCFTPDGSFFAGEYMALDDSTDFLSYGGTISRLVQSPDEEHWVTQCAGNCPCGGVVSIESEEDGNISGRYNGSNCSRHLDGTFTGILTD